MPSREYFFKTDDQFKALLETDEQRSCLSSTVDDAFNQPTEAYDRDDRWCDESWVVPGTQDLILAVAIPHAVLNYDLTRYIGSKWLPKNKKDQGNVIDVSAWRGTEKSLAMHSCLAARGGTDFSVIAALIKNGRLPWVTRVQVWRAGQDSLSNIIKDAKAITLARRCETVSQGQGASTTAAESGKKKRAAKRPREDDAANTGSQSSHASSVVFGLRFDGEDMTAKDIASTLASMPGLRSVFVDCRFSPLTAAHVAAFASIPELEHLCLSGHDEVDEGVAMTAACKKFRKLSTCCLRNTTMPTGAVKAIAGLPTIRALCVSGCTKADVSAAVKTGKTLDLLEARYTRISGAALKALAAHGTLRDLCLTRTHLSSDKDFAPICDFPKLTALDVSSTRISTAAVKKIATALPNLKRLDISCCHSLREAAVTEVAAMLPHIEEFKVEGKKLKGGTRKTLGTRFVDSD